MTYPSQTADKFILRLPDGLRQTIKEQAALNNRSMNAEVVYELMNAYGLQEDAPVAGPSAPTGVNLSREDINKLTSLLGRLARDVARLSPSQEEDAP